MWEGVTVEVAAGISDVDARVDGYNKHGGQDFLAQQGFYQLNSFVAHCQRQSTIYSPMTSFVTSMGEGAVPLPFTPSFISVLATDAEEGCSEGWLDFSYIGLGCLYLVVRMCFQNNFCHTPLVAGDQENLV